MKITIDTSSLKLAFLLYYRDQMIPGNVISIEWLKFWSEVKPRCKEETQSDK